MKGIPEVRRPSIKDAIFDKTTEILASWTTSESNKVKFTFIRQNWPHNTLTGEKLEWGTTGDHAKKLIVG